MTECETVILRFIQVWTSIFYKSIKKLRKKNNGPKKHNGFCGNAGTGILNCPAEKLTKARNILQRKTKRLQAKLPDCPLYNSSCPHEISCKFIQFI